MQQEINKEKLREILNKQHTDCLKQIITQTEQKIQELSDYGDVLDVKTEITIGHSMENKICHTSYADYYGGIIKSKKENLK